MTFITGGIGLGVEFGKILVGLDTQLGFCKVMDGEAGKHRNEDVSFSSVPLYRDCDGDANGSS